VENAFVLLAVLACPIGMGLMMWFMSKGMRSGQSGGEKGGSGSVEELRREQSRLTAEIDRLEQNGRRADGDRTPALRGEHSRNKP
jgi:hypothetical protein